MNINFTGSTGAIIPGDRSGMNDLGVRRIGRAGACLLIACLAGALTACTRAGRDEAMVEELVKMEEVGEREVSKQRVEEIEEQIERYRKEVLRTVDATGQLGVYYKMLAVEYMRGSMYGAAYEALEKAIAIHPENPILFYYSAVCTARMSKAQVISEDRIRWLERSESLYRRALSFDPDYGAALYGLSVLYVFELDRPQEAEGPLKRLLTVQSKDIDGRFLLARVYYSLGKLENAIELYREIETLSDIEQVREQARSGRKQAEDELYGAQ
jgi:tetratricopeptide (TPR) repeat protein